MNKKVDLSLLIKISILGLLTTLLLSACTTAPAVPTATPTNPPPPEIPALPTYTPKPPTATLPPFKNILVYDMPEMYQVTVKTVQYQTLSQPSKMLAMDIYYPAEWSPASRLPALIFANAFPLNTQVGECGRSCWSYPSWGRLTAANGLIAITYDTEQVNDLEAVVAHIRSNEAELGIDGDQIGVMGSSSDAVLAQSFAYQENRDYLKFAIFYYGYLLTPDNLMRDEYNKLCLEYGCYASELPDVKKLRVDLPTLIVRCGKDNLFNHEPIDHFAQLADEAGVPLTLIKFDEGSHGFDASDTSLGQVKVKAIEIIKQTLEFMKANTSNK